MLLTYSGALNLSIDQAFFSPPTYSHLTRLIYCISQSFAVLRHASFKNLIVSLLLEYYFAVYELVAPH